jgi:hypothetical protein
MSENLRWINSTDHKRINRIVTRSVDVVAAARRDLEKHRHLGDRQGLSDFEELKLPPHIEDYQNLSSPQRRKLFRKLLRTTDTVSPGMRGSGCLPLTCKEDHQVKKSGDKAATCSESKNLQSVRFRKQQLHTPPPMLEKKEPRRVEGRIDRRRKPRGRELAPRENSADQVSAMFICWTQRLNYLINVVFGVLTTALLMSWIVSAKSPDPLASSASHEQARSEQQVPIPSFGPSSYPAQGFHILSTAFPEPLPTIAQDISFMLSFARPLRASAPGVAVFPYTGLPQPLPSFPDDIARLIWIATPQKRIH